MASSPDFRIDLDGGTQANVQSEQATGKPKERKVTFDFAALNQAPYSIAQKHSDADAALDTITATAPMPDNEDHLVTLADLDLAPVRQANPAKELREKFGLWSTAGALASRTDLTTTFRGGLLGGVQRQSLPASVQYTPALPQRGFSAVVPTNLTEFVDAADHNRVVNALTSQPTAWIGPQVEVTYRKPMRLSFTWVDDSEAGASPRHCKVATEANLMNVLGEGSTFCVTTCRIEDPSLTVPIEAPPRSNVLPNYLQESEPSRIGTEEPALTLSLSAEARRKLSAIDGPRWNQALIGLLDDALQAIGRGEQVPGASLFWAKGRHERLVFRFFGLVPKSSEQAPPKEVMWLELQLETRKGQWEPIKAATWGLGHATDRRYDLRGHDRHRTDGSTLTSGSLARTHRSSNVSVPGSHLNHGPSTTPSIVYTAHRRTLEEEKVFKRIEAQIAGFESAGPAVKWYYEHSKKAFKVLFEGATALQSGVRRYDPSVSPSTTQIVVSSATGAGASAAGAVAEFGASVIGLVPLVSSGASAAKAVADQWATNKFNKDNSRIGKILDPSQNTQEVFCDTMARGLTELHQHDALQVAQKKQQKIEAEESSIAKTARKKAEHKFQQMLSSRDPRESRLECSVRKLATDHACAIVMALSKGDREIDLSALGEERYGKDRLKVEPILLWHRQQLPDDASRPSVQQVQDVAGRTAWGVLSSTFSRGELKVNRPPTLYQWPEPIEKKGSLNWENINARLRGLDDSWSLRLDDRLEKVVVDANVELSSVRGSQQALGRGLDTARDEQTRLATKVAEHALTLEQQAVKIDQQAVKIDEQTAKIDQQRADIDQHRGDADQQRKAIEEHSVRLTDGDARVNQLRKRLVEIDTLIDEKADVDAVEALEASQQEINARLDFVEADAEVVSDLVRDTFDSIDDIDTEIIVHGAAIEEQQAHLRRKVGRGEFNVVAHEVARVQRSFTHLSVHELSALRRENQALREENTALRQAFERRSARIEVQTNLTRLSPIHSLEALKVYFTLDTALANSRSLVRDAGGEVTHLRTWSGLRRSLATTLQAAHPKGCTLQELSTFLARQGLTVTHPETLQNAIFAVLGIAERTAQA